MGVRGAYAAAMPVLPMFPLGSVLLPSVVLPLHLFEPRYLALARDCLAGDREFGVVLIERGSEVGGGDVRGDIGTVAHIIEAAELPDGRYALAAVGARRIRVIRWLPDDPYPRAEVEDWPDPDPSEDAIGSLGVTIGRLRRMLALRAELGDHTVPATQELSDDPVLGSYQAVAISGLGPLDQRELLAAATVEARLDRLGALLSEEEQFLAQRLAMDETLTDPDDPGDVGLPDRDAP